MGSLRGEGNEVEVVSIPFLTGLCLLLWDLADAACADDVSIPFLTGLCLLAVRKLYLRD